MPLKSFTLLSSILVHTPRLGVSGAKLSFQETTTTRLLSTQAASWADPALAFTPLPTPQSPGDIQNLWLSICVCPTMKLPPGTGRVSEGPKRKSNYKPEDNCKGERECEPHRVNTARRTQRMDEGETKWDIGYAKWGKTSSNLSFCIRRYIYISE